MSDLYNPLNSLIEGCWFKLICGASFQHLPAVRNLTLAYTLAGADCIDVAADPAVIGAAKEGIQAAAELAEQAQARGFGYQGLPWLMVSLNDGEDPHFRKAEFNPSDCPSECPRPCEKICPAQAIAFNRDGDHFSGVIDQQCYGCGRCLPICPNQLIFARSYVSTPEAIASLVLPHGIDALEIHTQVGRLADFKRLWSSISPRVDQLKLLAISCPDGEDLIDYLWALYEVISPLPCSLIWQTDGRPMSGDIGVGTTHAAIKLGQKVLAANLPGYIQLAGGTNDYTVAKLKSLGILKSHESQKLIDLNEKFEFERANLLSEHVAFPSQYQTISGVAYGSYARVLMTSVLDQLEKENMEVAYALLSSQQPSSIKQLEDFPSLLWQAVEVANSLVSQLKSSKYQLSVNR